MDLSLQNRGTLTVAVLRLQARGVPEATNSGNTEESHQCLLKVGGGRGTDREGGGKCGSGQGWARREQS